MLKSGFKLHRLALTLCLVFTGFGVLTPLSLIDGINCSGRPPAGLDVENPLIDREIAFFTNYGQRWMQEGIDRSADYLPLIKEIFARHGVPTELACIAFVESGFNNKALSTAWAYGMWQFMPETARAFGLRIDWEVDERQDFWRSSEAAARYLKGLHDEFGDWLLAAAAYNAGQNYLRARLEATGAGSFWELAGQGALWQETTHYVPRILATIRIFANPEKYGFIPANEKSIVVCRGRTRANTLYEVANLYGIPLEQLVKLNPHLEHGYIPSDSRGYELVLPHPGEFFDQSDRAGLI